jgi:hypothetical protein
MDLARKAIDRRGARRGSEALMDTDERLPPDLTWEPDGHLSDIALTMLADGEQSLLDEGAPGHAASCEACLMRLGTAAMMSLRVGEELPAIAARASAPLPAQAQQPLAGLAVSMDMRAAAIAPERRSPLPLSQGVRALPLRALAAAIVLAAIGATPSLIAGTARIPEIVTTVLRALMLIGRSAIDLARAGASGGLGVAPALSWLSAGLLVIAGLVVARTMSRRRILQEGGM